MILLNYRDSRPIYEQIKEGLRQLIITGALGSNEKLPSVREMAAQLAINPNTIQRAYRELEAEGYIYTIAGKGSFATDTPHRDSTHISQLLEQFKHLAAELQFLGISRDALIQQIDTFEKEHTR